MPHKPFLVERRHVWAVLSCFVALWALYVVSLEWQHRTSTQTGRTAAEAKRLAKQNRVLLRKNRELTRRVDRESVARGELRVEQLRLLCGRDNATNRSLVNYIVAASSPAALRKIAYYRDHPEELPDVAAVTRRAKAAFPQRDCSKIKVTPKKGAD